MTAGDGMMHGGALDRMADLFPQAPQPWIDLSTGINPFPYPLPPCRDTLWQRLPTEAAVSRCRQAVAAAFGCNPDHVLPVPGSELLIRLLPLIVPTRGRVLILTPGYHDHHQSWCQAGYDVVPSQDPLTEAEPGDTVVVINPNNPDGRTFSADELLALHHRLRRQDGLLIVDEAYVETRPELSLAPRIGSPGLIVLRSFGKFFGLAGVRLGALLADQTVLQAAKRLFGHWPLSGPALEIGAIAYADCHWQCRMRYRLETEAAALDTLLTQAGLTVMGGTSLFRMVQSVDASGLWQRLGRAGIAVRRFDDLPDRLRFGLVPDLAAQARLAGALALTEAATDV